MNLSLEALVPYCNILAAAAYGIMSAPLLFVNWIHVPEPMVSVDRQGGITGAL
jgi:hypothetical protein